MTEVSQESKFAVTLPLVKAWQDDAGQMWVEGVASSTSLDRQRERMTRNAIAKMQQYQGIDLLPSHNAGPLEELGTIEECWADNDSFRLKARLDETSPQAMRLFKRLAEGRQYSLSVGGRVTKAYWDFDAEARARIRHIDDVVLDHVAVCRPRQAANPDTYLATLAKAAEPVTEDGPPQAADDNEDLIRRLGQAALDACRRLWPFGKSTTEAEARAEPQEPGELEALRAEVATLRKQLQQTTTKTAVPQPDNAAAHQDVTEPEPGRRQSLIAEQRPATDRQRNFWKGVL